MATKKEVGKKQTNDIMTLYKESFDDYQRMSFILGRISALLDVGNAISDSINEAIMNDEAVLEDVKARVRVKKSDEKPKTTRKKTTKKEVKKDE